MTWVSDGALERLREAVDEPDLSGTKYRDPLLVGRGGMATVWEVLDTDLHRHVALKVLGGGARGERAAARMANEARIIAGLEHPGIVPVHDIGTLGDGRVYYAMKLVRGRRLDEAARELHDLAERLRLFARLCEPVAFAHAHGVIHRDLKPQNVMVGSFGEVLVVDWGLAKLGEAMREGAGPVPGAEGAAVRAADGAAMGAAGGAATGETGGAAMGETGGAASSQTGEEAAAAAPSSGPRIEAATMDTAHGTVLGTPGYMAPEQARGQVDRIDARADVHALGAILYFLLTGRSPASSTPPGGVAIRGGDGPSIDPTPAPGGRLPRRTVAVPDDRPSGRPTATRAGDGHAQAAAGATTASPRDVDPSIPRSLEAVCRKAMSADPEQRYASVAELAADVRRFLDESRVRAYREGPVAMVVRLASKYRTPLLLVVAYLVMRAVLLLVTG